MKPVKLIMDKVLKIDRHRTFPHYASQRFETWFRKEAAGEQGNFKKHVSYFHGCYVNYNFPELGRVHLVKVLNALGYGVRLLDEERCCGVAKIANRCVNEATRDAEINIRAIRKAVERGGRCARNLIHMLLHYPRRVSPRAESRQQGYTLSRLARHPLHFQPARRGESKNCLPQGL